MNIKAGAREHWGWGTWKLRLGHMNIKAGAPGCIGSQRLKIKGCKEFKGQNVQPPPPSTYPSHPPPPQEISFHITFLGIKWQQTRWHANNARQWDHVSKVMGGIYNHYVRLRTVIFQLRKMFDCGKIQACFTGKETSLLESAKIHACLTGKIHACLTLLRCKFAWLW